MTPQPPQQPLPPLSRRQWLRRAAAPVGALFLPRSALGQGTVRRRAGAEQAIMIFLQGGISHYESWDPKPDAPSAVRGEFGSIPTRVPGTRLCEHLPLLAGQAHRFSLVRSVHHPTPDHNLAIHMLLTGWHLDGASVDGKNRNVNPSLGAVVARFLSLRRPDLPAYVCVPHRDQLGHRLHYASAGFLGPAYDPFDSGLVPPGVESSFAAPADLGLNPRLSAGRLKERIDLLEAFEHQAGTGRGGADEFRRRGYEMLVRNAAGRAFDLNRETIELRRRYGAHGMGQEALLARRLAEAGVPFTLVNFALDQVKGQDWDTHEDNFRLLKDRLLPPMDRAVSTLLDDLAERGLLETTLVAVVSEFGRTPQINAKAGRDHWPNVFSVLLAGGGLKPGIVVGSSTRGGDEPRDRPIHLYDVLATIYHQLGVPARAELRDPLGRAVPVLGEGKAIGELL